MVDSQRFWTMCPVCGGDGEIDENRVDPITFVETWIKLTCPKCAGVGFTVAGRLDDDLVDLLNDILDKVNDIKEKVDEL